MCWNAFSGFAGGYNIYVSTRIFTRTMLALYRAPIDSWDRVTTETFNAILSIAEYPTLS